MRLRCGKLRGVGEGAERERPALARERIEQPPAHFDALNSALLPVRLFFLVALVGPFFGRIRLRFALHQEKTPLLANVRERKMVADAGLRSAPRGTPGVYP